MEIEMAIKIDPEIWQQYPHLKIGVLNAHNINNEGKGDEALQVLRKSEHDAKNRYAQTELGEVGKLIDWREAFRSFGYKPSSTRCSAEALLRRAVKGKELPDISPIVNLYNHISLKYTLPAGADDLDQVEGQVRLTVAKGDESFVAMGGGEKEIAKAGEVIYRDDVDRRRFLETIEQTVAWRFGCNCGWAQNE